MENINSKLRQNRKLEHIRQAMDLGNGTENGLVDIHLVHQSLPELSEDEIDISYRFEGKELSAPLIINALTGGNREVASINRVLARLAGRAGIAMAVGSQTAALEDQRLRDTFAVVREENPHGVIMGNIGGMASPEQAREAVAMIDADALQIHLNVPQELAMAEGERDFRGILDNIAAIQEALPVPVVVKEVGFGLSREAAGELQRRGVKWVDISGRGGTNFIAIERGRGAQRFGVELEAWGITTSVSLLEALSLPRPIKCIASGGINNSLDIAKCLCLGAEMVGIAGYFLRLLLNQSEKALADEIESLLQGLRAVLLMTGARNLAELSRKPAVITGKTREWLEQRGISTNHYAQRGRSLP
ncbi:MAG: type 2 isopentenyl-diphosphate Delta-isomerase [Syntrophomonadaceae bacterium]|nr:type 2 isopentenyl-diphosphate Delta-isomerase [Syntrophomonadaceae bacterium]